MGSHKRKQEGFFPLSLEKRKMDKENAEKCDRICGITFAYAILKMPLYAENYAICGFCKICE